MDEVMALLPRPQELLHPKNFTHYLSIVCAHQRYYYGIELRQYFWYCESIIRLIMSCDSALPNLVHFSNTKGHWKQQFIQCP